MFHPSINMKNNILIGNDMTDGGNIIIPIDMVRVETIMSMTRKGRAIRKPISKPLRSSEIIKAGTRILRSTVAGSPELSGLTGGIMMDGLFVFV